MEVKDNEYLSAHFINVPFPRKLPAAQNEFESGFSALTLCVLRLYNAAQAGCPLMVSGLCSTWMRNEKLQGKHIGVECSVDEKRGLRAHTLSMIIAS